jgi:outer membrane protein, adhesin transport system
VLSALLIPGIATGETLSSAVSRALSINPEVQSLRSSTMAANFGVDAARGLSGPQIALDASARVATDFQGSNDGWNASLSARQSIYDGGLARSELRRAHADEGSIASRLADQALVTALETTQAYLEVQRSRGLTRILEANVARLETLRGKVRRRAKAGAASDIDLYDASAKVDAAKLNLLDAKSQLADAIVDYRSLVGHAPERLESVSSPTGALPTSPDEAVRLAKKRSPRILAVTYDALSAEALADAARAAVDPKIDLDIATNHANGLGSDDGASRDLSAQISFRFDLFDGGTARARIRKARYEALATRQQAQAVALKVEREVRQSWNAIHVARSRARTLNSQLTNARKSLRISVRRYDAGVASLSRLLDQHADLAAAEVAWLNSEFTHRFNVYRVLAGSGRLLRALNITSRGPGVSQ